MRIKNMVMAGFLLLVGLMNLSAQDYQTKITQLRKKREQITLQEKEALKKEIETIDKQLTDKEISLEEATKLKEEAAARRALNIENRLAMVDNEIALLERNKDSVLVLDEPGWVYREWEEDDDDDDDSVTIRIDVDDDWKVEGPWDEDWPWDEGDWPWNSKRYDRRTYSDFVVAFGLNNSIREGESLGDTPYDTWGSQFLELGWQWRTRVFQNTNFLRFHYGFSFQFNGLKPDHNQYFQVNGLETDLVDYPYELSKSKFHMDNIVVPLYFEFGPSKYVDYGDRVRYSIAKKFKVGLGGYGGFNFKTRQKLKYYIDGEKVKEKRKKGYNTSDFIYGLSGYVGVGSVHLYVKYDLNPVFRHNPVEEHNISMGFRFTL